MDVKDLSWNETLTKRFNHPLLPRSIRGVIIGKSGCGKTTLLLNLLLRPGWLDQRSYICFARYATAIGACVTHWLPLLRGAL